MAEIIFKDVCKSFGDTKVIEHLNLEIKDGEFTVLVGPSGCGKTTLLRMIAGIGPATSGELLMDGEDISEVPPGKRGIAMVFQNYAIYPTMTVKGNIEFGLKNKKVPKAERERLISETAEIVGLTPYLNRKPSALSGGQRQRVALARAMVKNPKVFLMDEPLSNLDAKLRVSMRTELIELHHRLKTTFVYVTHDQSEAMSMADTIILMDGGKIQQQASPETVYDDPNNIFTAQFIGTPPMNIRALPEEKGYVGFRPEKVVLAREKTNLLYQRPARILTREMLGSETLYKVQLPDENAEQEDNTVMVKSADHGFCVGEEVTLAADENGLYFFDYEKNRVRREDMEDKDSWYRLAGGGK
ncbi:MAG: ABC transporter ATP-binding protein [Clostridiales bacterium]|nr:ABC transporter ATP-binding protein [Clostridiales bacterium]